MIDCRGNEVVLGSKVAVYEKNCFKYHGVVDEIFDDYLTIKGDDSHYRGEDVRVL